MNVLEYVTQAGLINVLFYWYNALISGIFIEINIETTASASFVCSLFNTLAYRQTNICCQR